MIFDNTDRRKGKLPLLLAERYPDQPFRHVLLGVNRRVDRALSAMRR